MSEPYTMLRVEIAIDDGLFGSGGEATLAAQDVLRRMNETTPAAAHNAPLRATEREEQAAADAARIEHMAKRVKPETPDERFAAFVHDHPDVIGAVVGVCRDMKRAGCTNFGIKAAWEVVRWQRATSAHMAAALYKGGDPALNNDFTAPLARYIMANFRDLSEFFTTRRRRCELPGCLEVADD